MHVSAVHSYTHTQTHTFVCLSIFKMLNQMASSYPIVRLYAITTLPHFLMSYSQ